MRWRDEWVAGTPGYSDRELRMILDAARRDITLLRERLPAGQALLGQVGDDHDTELAGQLRALARTGTVPAGVGGWRVRQAVAERVFVTRRDVPAMLVLLVAVTGRNVETIKELTAEHRVLADRAVEVHLLKRRRGAGRWWQTATWEIGPTAGELGDRPTLPPLLVHRLTARRDKLRDFCTRHDPTGLE